MLGYIWNRLPDYFASAREAYKSLACSKFMYNYIVIVVSGNWAGCPNTGQHSSSAKILISWWKQRQKSSLSAGENDWCITMAGNFTYQYLWQIGPVEKITKRFKEQKNQKNSCCCSFHLSLPPKYQQFTQSEAWLPRTRIKYLLHNTFNYMYKNFINPICK